MKYTDYKQVRKLAANILKSDKKIFQLTDDLNEKLKTLKRSFEDDGFEPVEEFVRTLSQKLVATQESFMTVASQLQMYADILESGKGAKP